MSEIKQFSDFDGDGNDDLMDYTSTPKLWKFFNGKDHMLVQSVTNGLNSKVQFSYEPITNNDNAAMTRLAGSIRI